MNYESANWTVLFIGKTKLVFTKANLADHFTTYPQFHEINALNLKNILRIDFRTPSISFLKVEGDKV